MRTPILPLLLLPFLLLAGVSCDDHEEKKASTKKVSKPQADVRGDPSVEVEAFTGAHTRLVWVEFTKAGSSDSFATSEGLVLLGLDTRDGLGERVIQSKPGNYSRPILSCEGDCILWTDKNTVRKGGKKHYKPVIYLTGWKGGKPIRLADGYAVDCWRDPATKIEYVYAVQNLKPTKGLALEGARLVRFPLNEPEKIEVVYDDTPITPDNVQLSRDGTRASGQFPWPHAGVLRLTDGKWTAKKFTIGCWSSLAPDNSGVAWSFDGRHKSVAMFADDGAKNWVVKFDTVPGGAGLEFYHPRWSNHPRFIVITGPYAKKKGHEGSVINKGGDSAQVFMGRLSETAEKVEAWLQVSHDMHGESYPDAWIAGAEQADLKGFSIPRDGGTLPAFADSWPTSREGLLFLWQDRTTLNSFTSRDGSKHEGIMENRNAARHGRFNEMRLDGGHFEAETESSAAAMQHLGAKPEAAFEALVLPPESGDASPQESDGMIFRAPGFFIGLRQGRLVVEKQQVALESEAPLPKVPFHLVVNRGADDAHGFEAHVNGEPFVLAPAKNGLGAGPPTETLVFGGDWSGGLLHVALYDHALTDEDIAANAGAARSCIATFPAAPPRVQLMGKLAEVSALPTPEGIAPYTSSLVAYVYEVEKVTAGELKTQKVLVKHWCMLDQKVVQGFPRETGKSYELMLEREADHTHLKGERVMDDTTAFDLEPWFDVSPPRVVDAVAPEGK